jgi:hypothetical protein
MRLFLSILMIRIILPQTKFDNVVVSQLNNIGLSINYAEAKIGVSILNWILISIFLRWHYFLLSYNTTFNIVLIHMQLNLTA